MNKKQYYEAIKEYNLLAEEKEFNPDFLTKEKQDRFESRREMLLNKVRYMDRMASAAAYDNTIDKSLRNLRILEIRLEESQKLEKEYYEKSWCEELWFGYLTRNQMLIGGVIFLLIILMRYLTRWF